MTKGKTQNINLPTLGNMFQPLKSHEIPLVYVQSGIKLRINEKYSHCIPAGRKTTPSPKAAFNMNKHTPLLLLNFVVLSTPFHQGFNRPKVVRTAPIGFLCRKVTSRGNPRHLKSTNPSQDQPKPLVLRMVLCMHMPVLYISALFLNPGELYRRYRKGLTYLTASF